jgi:hypothetical protein
MSGHTAVSPKVGRINGRVTLWMFDEEFSLWGNVGFQILQLIAAAVENGQLWM